MKPLENDQKWNLSLDIKELHLPFFSTLLCIVQGDKNSRRKLQCFLVGVLKRQFGAAEWLRISSQ